MKRTKWFLMTLAVLFLADGLILNPCFLKLSAYTHDDFMGWMPKRNFSRTYGQRDAAGTKYDAVFALDDHRFRVFGSTSNQRTKILFVGDSFTADPYAGNDEMYFSVVKSTLRQRFNKDVEVFAAGGGGYGTLQEYLLVKDLIPVINPDIFVLQFCANDLYNNVSHWEEQGIVRSQSFLRPYLSATTGEMHHIASPKARFYRFLYRNSFLFRRIDSLLQGFQFRYYGGYFERMSAGEKERYLEESFAVTRKILLSLKSRFGSDARLFMMIDLTDDGSINELQMRLAQEAGFIPLVSPAKKLDAAEKDRLVVHHSDGGHLNNLGNRIWGEALASELAPYLKK